MSQTTVTSSTQLRESTSVRQILRAYDIHQTGEEASQRSGWDLETPFETSQRRDWDFNRNRIPPYREPATSHRLSDRPSGRNYVESTIVLMMFSGSYMVAVR